MKKKWLSVLFALALAGTLTACGATEPTDTNEIQVQEVGGEDKEAIYIGQTNIIDAVTPIEGGTPWSLTSHGVSESVYTQDKDGNLISRFIETLTAIDDTTWEATMKQDVKFSDGSAVDAKALCDSMNEVMQENPLSNATVGKAVFTPIDDYSFSIKTERPTKIMRSVLAEWTNIVFKHNEDDTYIFTGPYMIDKLETGAELDLKPNPYYPDAENRSDVVIKVFQDTSAMKLAYESNEIDMAFTITPDVAEMLEKEGHTIKNIDAGYQYFALPNLQRAPLDDIAVRQAINVALNRDDMVTALKGGQVATGAFAHYYSFAGDSKVEYNPEDAKKRLDEAGWRLNGQGLREKDGQVLHLKLVTYPSRPDLSILMQIAVSQLGELGIETSTELVDNIDEAGKSGDFDILFYGQHSAPTGDPAFFLNQFFRTGEAKNFGQYSSSEYEAILDQMGELEQGAERDELAKEAQRKLFDDLPIFYLVDPQWHIAVSPKLKDYQPYCGDYYIVNAQLGL